ncbi:hypothetical protein GINT2_000575 [Glugoides intestinalis]
MTDSPFNLKNQDHHKTVLSRPNLVLINVDADVSNIDRNPNSTSNPQLDSRSDSLENRIKNFIIAGQVLKNEFVVWINETTTLKEQIIRFKKYILDSGYVVSMNSSSNKYSTELYPFETLEKKHLELIVTYRDVLKDKYYTFLKDKECILSEIDGIKNINDRESHNSQIFDHYNELNFIVLKANNTIEEEINDYLAMENSYNSFKAIDDRKRINEEKISIENGYVRIFLSKGTPLINTPAYLVPSDPCYKKTYKILGGIQAGKMANCFRVEELETNKIYIMKSIPSSFGAIAKNEAKIARALQHENIVTLKGTFESEKNFYMIFEFCEKGSLSANIFNLTAPLQKEKAVEYIKQIVNGVAYIHSKKIIHNDIKPENIFVDKNDNIKIGDFGGSIFSSTDIKSIAGTHGYMAPEVFYFRKPSINADIWSLGNVFCEVFLGKRSKYVYTEMVNENTFDYIKNSNLEENWKKLILEMLQNNPRIRPTIDQIQERIENF